MHNFSKVAFILTKIVDKMLKKIIKIGQDIKRGKKWQRMGG